MFKSNTNGLNGLKQKLIQIITFASIGVLLTLSLVVARQGKVQGAPSTTLNFQARILNKTGSLVPDGNYHVEFKIYNAASGGTALWTETYSTSTTLVQVKNGFLSVRLGTHDSLADETDIEWSQENYLTMNIGGTGGSASWDGEMSPRIKLTAVPYAFQSEQLAKTELDGNRGSLAFDALSANRSILLPDASGTVCLQNSASCGFLTGTASDYIQNGTTLQSNANFNIGASSGVAATITGAAGQSILILNQNGGAAALTVSSVGNATLAGDLAVNGGDITSTGALNISPGGAMTLGATTQTATIQGSTVSVTSTGVGNDIAFTSADQIVLNATTGGVDMNGSVAVGDTATVSAVAGLNVGETYTNTDTCSGFGCHGALIGVTANNVTAGGINGVYASVSAAAGAFTLPQATSITAGTNDAGAGSTITNNYGLYVQTQTAGTNDYGIYVQGADTYGLWVDNGATRLDGTLELQSLGTADTDEYLCRNSSDVLSTCSNAPLTSATAFMQGGNGFTATAVLGTNDAYNLELETGGTTRLTIDTTGDATLTGDLVVQGTATSSFGGLLTVAGNTTLGDASDDSLTITGTSVILPNNLNFDSNTLFVDAANNRVGVGTASPGTALDVNGRIRGNEAIELQQNSNLGSFVTASSSSYIYNSNSGGTGPFSANGSLILQTRSDTDRGFYFVTGSTPTEKLRIEGDGDVVIGGDGSPEAMLDLDGAITGTTTRDLANFNLVNQTSSGTQYGLRVINDNQSANAITEALMVLENQETSVDRVTDYLLISKADASTDTSSDAIDVSDAQLYNGINVGQNYILGAGIRQFSSSSTVWTWEDVSSGDGNDLMTLTDDGTTGSLDISGMLTAGAADGFQVDSSGAIAAATGVTSSGNIIFSGLNCTANANGGAITADASGQLSCTDDNDTAGAITLQNVYDNDTDGSNVVVNLSSTDGSILFRDNGTPLGGTLFAVQDSTGASNYLSVAATGLTTSGDLAVNGGDITSTGALNITPGGAMTLGVTTQTATLQGSTTTITSTGAGNDITLTSADQIILNPGTAASGVDINGVLAIGNNATPNELIASQVNQTYTGSNCGFGCYGSASTITSNNVTSGFVTAGYFLNQTAVAGFTLPAAYGAYVQTTSKGAGSTITKNVGVYVGTQTAGTNNAGIVIGETSGGTNNVNLLLGTTETGVSTPTIPTGNYSIYSQSIDQSYFAGNLGVLDSSPTAALTVGNGDLFQVNSSGAIAAATGVTSSGTIIFSGLNCTANANGGAITADASGQLSCTDDNDTAANAFLQGGNAFGATAVLGTTDANALTFVTGSGGPNTRLTISAAGATTVHGGLTAEAGFTTSGGNVNLNASGSGSITLGNNSATTNVVINSASGGTISIGAGAFSRTITIGSGNADQTVSIGNTSGGTAVNVSSGDNGISLSALGSSSVGVRVRSTSGNSANTFKIQNTDLSDTLFRADTSSNLIKVGDNDNDATVFVVDKVATANLPSAAGGGLDGGIIYDSTGTGKFKIYEGGQIKELCNMTDLGCGVGATVTLQDAYGNGNTITTTDARNLSFTLANTATDSHFNINIVSGSAGEFKVQSNGTDVLQIGAAGQLQLDTQGTGGGILIGTDTQLYRSAANTISTASGDAFTVQGLLTGTAGTTISGGAISLNDSGSANTTINTSGTGDVTIGNDGGNTDVTINSGGTINIGNNAQARTVRVATGAAAQTLELGSTNGASNTTIRGGTSGITLSSAGGILIDPSTDTTDAFVIQDSGATNTLFTADTTVNKLFVGDGDNTSAANTTLLVVDSASTANIEDTIGTEDGAMIYDSTLGKFKIHEGGEWKIICNTVDAGCGASGTSQDLQEAYDNSTSPATIISSSGTKNIIFKSGSTNSTGLFQIQDSGATNTLFAADTTNNQIKIGDDTGTTLASYTLLVLDRVDDGDQLTTGVNGAMVYDDEYSRFMVYDNGWKELCNKTDLGCGSAGVAQTLQDAYNNSPSPALITTTSATKDIIFKSGPTFNSTGMFQLQNSSGDELFVADTTNFRVSIGSNALPANGVLTVGSNTTTGSGGIYFGTDTNLYRYAANSLRTDGNLQLGEGADRTFDVQGRSTNAAGNGLTISAGDAGSGGSAFAGGTLTLQGGDAAGTGNANGGNIILTGGAGTGTGAQGLVVIGTPTFTTTLDDANCFTSGALVASSCTISDTSVSSFSAIVVGFSTESQIATLPDPINTTPGRVIYITGANGSSDFTLSVNGGGQGNEIAMKANTSATMIWNGDDWTAAGASSSTTLQAAYNNTLTSAGGAEIVLNNTASSNGLTIRNNSSSPITGGLFEVQSSIGTNLFSVNNRGAELAANGGSETDGTWTTNWTATGGSSVARTTSGGEFVTGVAAAEVSTASASSGIVNNLSGNPTNVVGARYQVSFTAKSSEADLPVEVIYSRDGTNMNYCTDYVDGTDASQTISNTVWTKVTCTITIDSATAPSGAGPDLVIRKTTTGTTPTIWVDNLSFMRNDDTTQPSNVQIGGGLDGGPITLFTLDRASAPPVEAGDQTYLGSMYYDTVSGRIQCYEADGWGACGSAPDNYVNLVPEFAGAVLNGPGVGTMTADFCSDEFEVLEKNIELCDTGQALNFYHWTSPQASEQEYSIYVTYKLPGAFKQFADNNTITLMGRTDNITNGEVSYEVFTSKGGELTQCGSETNVTDSAANTWITKPLTGDEATGCGIDSTFADQNIIFKINVRTRSNANVYVGTLSFTTLGQ